MKPRHKVSRAAIELIKSFEGFRQQAAQLPDGPWTIGYGHTKTARAGARLTEADAELLLLYDLIEITSAVNDWTYTPLTQNQFDALVCFAFNVGLDGFRRSTVLRRINEGSMLQAACSFEMWRKADFEGERIVVDALVRRRAAEKALFLTPTNGWVPAPSPVLRPKLDYEVGASVPKDRPVDLRTTLVGETTTLVREDEPPQAPGAAPVEANRMAAAGEAVSARLGAMLPHPPWPQSPAADLASPPPPPPPAEAPPISRVPSVPAPSIEPELFDPALTPARPARAPVAALDLAMPEPEAHPSPLPANADLFHRPIYREEEASEDSLPDLDAEQVEPARLNFIPMMLIGLVGLAVFAGAIVWGFSAKPAGGLFNPVIVGGAIGLVGVVCIGAVVYSLLSRFGGREE
jgi:lysozyme